MLAAYINSFESFLLARSKIPARLPLEEHRKVVRDLVVSEFLEKHLGDRVGIGRGIIIDATTGASPNQDSGLNDIVIYRRDYPHLNLTDDINGFLAESVIATVEIVPTLTVEELRRSIRSVRTVKTRQRHFIKSQSADNLYQPPGILSYVIAFECSVPMRQVYQWVGGIYSRENITYPDMGKTHAERTRIQSPALDALFVPGRGSIIFDNAPTAFVGDDVRAQNPEMKWIVVDAAYGNLMPLFIFLTVAINSAFSQMMNPLPYFAGFSVPNSTVYLGS
ncbi:MAG TPA: DUF6602 domain-containing protein [Aggregatilineales bacterium]|nr:DUF6602 domain-containing protein [Aggregatilineales bacterium]